ncbi:hypothetical protein ABN763_04540 [Spongiivirga sp. MCCC 1A20706]|uniref:hypothetical protein n=1 Tax=Spongiivirga sp. MCCC 1A20706 TaxID=3160963 RepID=UPI0039775214
MNRVYLFIVIFLTPLFLSGQQEILKEKLKILGKESSVTNISLDIPVSVEENVFLFGFVHGSQTPQFVDFEILKQLHSQGVRYYAPEVDFSLAELLNQYLANGNEYLLKLITKKYKHRVPQDASVDFYNKWIKIYEFNLRLPESEKIRIIGTDIEVHPESTLTHLAFLYKSRANASPIVDSLKYFRNYDFDSIVVISGKPALKSGKSFGYFFDTEKTKFYNRLKAFYKENPKNTLLSFGQDSIVAKYVLDQEFTRNRDSLIYENWKKHIVPIIKKGEKVYANFGYAHVFQEKINDRKFLGYYLKRNKHFQVKSILGVMSDSEVLDDLKICKDGKIVLKGVAFRKGRYCNYTKSKKLDGDSSKEVMKGVSALKALFKSQITSIDLMKDPIFKEKDWFIDFDKANFPWTTTGSTLDNIQHLIYMRYSQASIPLVLLDE